MCVQLPADGTHGSCEVEEVGYLYIVYGFAHCSS